MRSIAVSVSLSVCLAYLKNSWQRERMDKASSVVTPSSIASYTPCVESGGGTPRRRSAAGKRGTATVHSDREMHATVGGGISRPPRGRRPAAGSPSCSRNSVACRRDSTRLRFYLATNEQTRRVYPSWSVRRKSAPADFFETIIDGPCGWRA